jgi:hypothetical protein
MVARKPFLLTRLFSALAGATAVTVATSAVAATPVWSEDLIGTFLVSCLHRPGSFADGAQVALSRGRYWYADDEMSSADQLNGLSQRGAVALEVATRFASVHEWNETKLCFHYERRNGVSTLTPWYSLYACQNTGSSNLSASAAGLLNDEKWPCRSRG